MGSTLTKSEEAQLAQTIEMFEVITQSQPFDYQSLEILKEAYVKLGRDTDAISTSKRIAEAYVEMGQLSSAILEYETILQRYPSDPDVQRALSQIETKANNFPIETAFIENPASKTAPDRPQPAAKVNGNGSVTGNGNGHGETIPDLEDGRKTLYKLFVEGKIISAGDFDLCWTAPPASAADVSVPFIELLAQKQILPVERSLKLISDKSRAGFIPLGSYDLDMDLARNFPRETCRRWCVMPFDRMSKSVFVATTNPFNQQAARELSKATSSRLLYYLAPPADLMKMIRRAFR